MSAATPSGGEGLPARIALAGYRRHLARWGIVLLGLILLVALAAHLEEVTTPFLLGLLVAYVLDPLVVAVERRGVRRDAAVVVLFGAVLLLCAGGLVALSLFVAHGVEDLARTLVGERLLDPNDADDKARLEQYRAALEAEPHQAPPLADEGGRVYLDLDRDGQRDPGLVELALERVGGPLAARLGPETRTQLKEQLKSSAAGLLRAASELGEGVKGSVQRASLFLSYVLLVPLYTFFLLHSLPDMRAAVRDHLPGAYRERILAIAGQIDRQVAAFFRGKLIVALLKGLVTGLGLLVVGVPFGPLVGLIAGVLSVVPLAGPVVGGALALILSWQPEGWLTQVVLVLIVFVVAEVVEAVAQPVILGREVGLSPLTLILALFAFGHLFGLLGVLLAVPIACVVKVLFLELLLPEIEALAREPGPPALASPRPVALAPRPAALAPATAPSVPSFAGLVRVDQGSGQG